ncbi:EscU/YscU/HrcU family type III secretion system export apparatus switch protein [Alkalispirochaeta sphaeroplastigenens]|uniref:EscU/YscU/HrcU family type III secretion system export apparatus switch protein n=1 Tax=Alkalispirochaeta sphaeroplastigenens TaxID=1187066 RepID=UPI000CDA76A1|nr:EscU/YscU/HrcU family type III secretion system export apparatus switch protein [Alkalispirochaeta sphaeroplastigenens]
MDEHISAAIRYDPDLPAPFVVARGKGHLARKLLSLARAAGVPVRSDADLAERLLWIEPGQAIPPELFAPVAEVLSFVLRLDSSVQPDQSPGAEVDSSGSRSADSSGIDSSGIGSASIASPEQFPR